jgi:hypothetical protein
MHFVELVALLVGLFSIVFAVLVVTKKAPPPGEADRTSPLNHDDAISLDAENLAEQGIREAYQALLPRLRQYAPQPWNVEERIDSDACTYTVIAGGREYPIDTPSLDTAESWDRATVALFSIVNSQLEQSEHRFYAINGGNDLLGMFLTTQEAEAARQGLSHERDWPYLPTDESPA